MCAGTAEEQARLTSYLQSPLDHIEGAKPIFFFSLQTGPYGNLELGNDRFSGYFSEHWNRKLMVTCHFHRPISVFRTETA